MLVYELEKLVPLCAMNCQEMFLVFAILFIITVFLFEFQKGK